MRERIKELAAGKVETIKPVILIQPETIKRSICAEFISRGELTIESLNRQLIKGVCYSSHSRVTLGHPTFSGRKCVLCYEINTIGLNSASTVAGKFSLVTCAGVFDVPFSFTCEQGAVEEPVRTLKTVEDFARYTKEEPEKAEKLFYTSTFQHISFMYASEYNALYANVLKSARGAEGVEEFLAAARAKETIRFSLVSDRIEDNNLTEEKTVSLLVKKNTWGFARLSVKSSCDWLKLEGSDYTTKDFGEDDTLSIPVTIHPDRLKPGLNEGFVTVLTAKGDLSCQFVLHQPEGVRLFTGGALSRKKEIASQTWHYLSYRISLVKDDQKETDRILSDWLSDTIEAMENNEGDLFFPLIRSYILFLMKREEEAEDCFNLVREPLYKNRVADPRSYFLAMFVRARILESDEQMDNTTRLIMKHYSEVEKDPALMLLALQSDTVYRENPSLAITRLKELYTGGCRSPLLYLEACLVYRAHPDLLRVLNDFELQSLFYGAKKQILTKELALSVGSVSNFNDRFKPFIYKLLTSLYKAFPDTALLEAICSFLIRTGCKSEKFFPWYEKGLAENLNVFGLNEHYLMTLPASYNKALPESLLLYYTYATALSGEQRENLYANILEFYGPDTMVYKEYRAQMEEYAVDQLLHGRISKKLVPLYRHLVLKEIVDERLATVLPDLLSAYQITCPVSSMRKVYVRCPELSYEDCYQLEDGVCCVSLYTQDSLLIFEDEYGCRFLDVPYEKELIFTDPALLSACEKLNPGHIMFVIRKCVSIASKAIKTEEDADILSEALNMAELHSSFRYRITARLLDFDVQHPEYPVSRDFLNKLNLKELAYHDRRRALELLIREGHFAAGYEYIAGNSVNSISFESFLSVVDDRVKQFGNELDNQLLGFTWYLFEKGQYTKRTLGYLARFYNGPDENMKVLLFTVKKEEIDQLDLSERLLTQMLFCQDASDITKVFELYLATGRSSMQILKAYFVFLSYRYFVKEETVEERFFEELLRFRHEQQAEFKEISICCIALLHYMTLHDGFTINQAKESEELLALLCRRGLYFGFYGLLYKKVTFPSELNGRVIIEYRNPEARHAYLSMEYLDTERVVEYSMTKMFEGVFVCWGVLFADETVRYSVTVLPANKEELVETVKDELLTSEMTFIKEGTLFGRVDELCRLNKAGEMKKLEERFVEFEAEEQLKQELFPLW